MNQKQHNRRKHNKAAGNACRVCGDFASDNSPYCTGCDPRKATDRHRDKYSAGESA